MVNCWKPLKLFVPKRDNQRDIAMGNQQLEAQRHKSSEVMMNKAEIDKKITKEQVIQICKLINSLKSDREIKLTLGLSINESSIRNIRLGKSYKYISSKYLK